MEFPNYNKVSLRFVFGMLISYLIFYEILNEFVGKYCWISNYTVQDAMVQIKFKTSNNKIWARSTK